MSISILLADDSITIQKVIGIIFGGEDYSLTVVDNGKAAVEKAIETNPDVLLIDALMPGMSGYEVCEQVRATPALANKPILILTGSFEPFDEEKAKSCGADAFLSKPFESQQIVSKVKELFELGASRSLAGAVEEEPVSPFMATPPPLPLQPEFAPVVEAPATPADIWGAFTPPVEQIAEVPVVEPPPVPVADDFSSLNEEPDTKPETPLAQEQPLSEQIGSKWVPTDEQTFEFEEEGVVEPPSSVFVEPSQVGQEQGFGDIEFGDSAPESKPSDISSEPYAYEASEPVSAFNKAAMPQILASIPEFDQTSKPDIIRSAALSVLHPGPSVETTEPVFETASSSLAEAAAVMAKESAAPEKTDTVSATLTEEQLKAAIASVSKDVIERIVWEVVPDLAEALIKDAIRRIKEGQ